MNKTEYGQKTLQNDIVCVAATHFDRVTSGFHHTIWAPRASNCAMLLTVTITEWSWSWNLKITDCDSSASLARIFLLGLESPVGRQARTFDRLIRPYNHRRDTCTQLISVYLRYESHLTPPHRVSTSKLARPFLLLTHIGPPEFRTGHHSNKCVIKGTFGVIVRDCSNAGEGAARGGHGERWTARAVMASDATARLSSPVAQLRCQGRFFGPWAALSQPRAS